MRYPVAVTAVLTVAACAPGVASAKTLQVDDDRHQCRSAPYSAVQSAVDAAAAGDEIRVCAGTYREQIVLPPDKPGLRLRAVSALKATLTQPPGGIPHDHHDPVLGNRHPASVLVVRGKKTLVRGFRIVGPTAYAAPDRCGGHNHPSAIGVPDGTVTVDSNRIVSARITCPDDFSGGTHEDGAAMVVGDVDGSFTIGTPAPFRAGAKVDRNTITGLSGVMAESNPLMTVQRNKMSGERAGFSLGESPGFTEERNYTAIVRANVISGYETGVFLYTGGRPLVTGNRLYDNGTGIEVVESARGDIRRNSLQGGGTGILLGRGSATAFGYLVRDNRVRGQSGDGIWADSGATGNQLSGNNVLGSGGLDCRDESHGARTAGTANFWSRNVGATDSPNVCRAP